MTEQQQISRSQAWLESLRPKTLPLAFAAIIVGTALAWWQGYFDPLVALLALITAGLLQILSNLANDYGDAVKGSDKPDRIGPLRGMQKGVITQQQMKRALIVTVVLICLSGLALVAVACHTLADFVGFLVLGGLSIIAAITYTVGNRPYGYIGLGDISVLVFFVSAGAYADSGADSACHRLWPAGNCRAQRQQPARYQQRQRERQEHAGSTFRCRQCPPLPCLPADGYAGLPGAV